MTSPCSQRRLGGFGLWAAEGTGLGVSGAAEGRVTQTCHSILFLTLTRRLLPMSRCTSAARKLSGKKKEGGNKAETPQGTGVGGGG